MNRFNTYLAALLLSVIACGCKSNSDNPDKVVATVRIHVEVTSDTSAFTTTVPILRTNPVMLTIDKDPILTEANVSAAKVVDVAGGFDLEIEFDRQGTWLLESYTTTHMGRHFAVFCAFEEKDHKKVGRWIAAPLEYHKISNGILGFTPDTTREEADQIALGLNNAAKKNKKEDAW